MSSNNTACMHPVRDLMIVALSAVAVGLVAFILVTRLGGTALNGLTGAATSFIAFVGAGLVVLSYLKRN
ncbi:hypothetical protein ABZY68_29230 [Streptomyces sp. NPDC006482]|uniref:hypothetical protein n=1 Tax=Streptomyces sp. NPDC006482 TaxID=3154306 RepID=UPI0033A9D01D